MQKSNDAAVRPQTSGGQALPPVNTVAITDLAEILALGMRDFRAAPVFGLFFSGIYVVGGWVLILLLMYFELPYLVYPMAAGFALIAPFVASGFYAVSRSLELADPGDPANENAGALSWGTILSTVRSMFDRDLGWMALVTGFSLFIWMDIAALLSFGFMGFHFFSFAELIDIVLTTPSGWLFLLVGNAAGAVIAFAVFSYTVISIPMLFDREVDFITAMLTSVRFVLLNPKPMMAWCAILALLTAISLLSGLVGLFVILPVLGHATWHLYRRATLREMAA